jgi:hypothetical protein
MMPYVDAAIAKVSKTAGILLHLSSCAPTGCACSSLPNCYSAVPWICFRRHCSNCGGVKCPGEEAKWDPASVVCGSGSYILRLRCYCTWVGYKLWLSVKCHSPAGENIVTRGLKGLTRGLVYLVMPFLLHCLKCAPLYVSQTVPEDCCVRIRKHLLLCGHHFIGIFRDGMKTSTKVRPVCGRSAWWSCANALCNIETPEVFTLDVHSNVKISTLVSYHRMSLESLQHCLSDICWYPGICAVYGAVVCSYDAVSR